MIQHVWAQNNINRSVSIYRLEYVVLKKRVNIMYYNNTSRALILPGGG